MLGMAWNENLASQVERGEEKEEEGPRGARRGGGSGGSEVETKIHIESELEESLTFLTKGMRGWEGIG